MRLSIITMECWGIKLACWRKTAGLSLIPSSYRPIELHGGYDLYHDWTKQIYMQVFSLVEVGVANNLIPSIIVAGRPTNRRLIGRLPKIGAGFLEDEDRGGVIGFSVAS